MVEEDNHTHVGGFNETCRISTMLADFLGLPHDAMVTRGSVARTVLMYVRDNGLWRPGNERLFDLDDENDVRASELRFLLDVAPGEEVGYYNFQELLNPHLKTRRIRRNAIVEQDEEKEEEKEEERKKEKSEKEEMDGGELQLQLCSTMKQFFNCFMCNRRL